MLLGAAMLPGGAGFCLLLVYVLASLCGDVVKALSPRLPPLLGMLLAGLVLRSAAIRFNLGLPAFHEREMASARETEIGAEAVAEAEAAQAESDGLFFEEGDPANEKGPGT